MNIGVFGGTFDPPHIGHLLVASHVCETLGLERMVFVPSSVSPHKRTGAHTPPDDRLAMVRLAVAGAPQMEVTDLEIRRGGVSFTIDTLRVLHAGHPHDTLVLIIGMDNVGDFGSWKEPDGILDIARVVVMTRPGYRIPERENRYVRRMEMCDVPEVEIASRDIRRRVREGRSVRWMVTPEVEHYIRQHGFYLTSAP
jgi:nicotinate-nucleotide adenylyltransferase